MNMAKLVSVVKNQNIDHVFAQRQMPLVLEEKATVCKTKSK